MNDEHKMLLVHAIKALKYRFIKATSGSNENFGEFKVSPQTRSPNEIINHMADLAAKTTCMIRESHFNVSSPPGADFRSEKERFHKELEGLLEVISSTDIDLKSGEKLLQGPILDMVTHIGQLAMLNGLFGNKIPGENYYEVIIE